MRGQERKPHDARTMAESFGADPMRYHQHRPSYPATMVTAILTEAPGRDVLDVGCGTGLAGQPFRDAHCEVLGIEVDPRMAEFARGKGLEVEVASFESWQSAGRRFDIVTAGTTWHWIDPRSGAFRAASVLRPGGVLAAFWNIQHPPPELAVDFAAVNARVAPGSPFAKRDLSRQYTRILDRASRGIRDTAMFDPPRVRRYRREQSYTRAQWLELAATFGGYERLSAAARDAFTAELGAAIDRRGGAFTMEWETLLLTAVKTG